MFNIGATPEVYEALGSLMCAALVGKALHQESRVLYYGLFLLLATGGDIAAGYLAAVVALCLYLIDAVLEVGK